MQRLLLLILICIPGNIFAQGIQFGHDLDKALAQAKKESKLVFVDFYTSWCGPCKMLNKNVFPQEKVGSFFNGRFINCKVQCDDNGVGAELQKKYKIMAYPTLMFLNGDGEIVYAKSGAPNADGLLQFARDAVNPELNLITIVKKYEDGDRSQATVKEYFEKMVKSRRTVKAQDDFLKYFDSLSEDQKQSAFCYDLLKELQFMPFTKLFNYIEDNVDAYYNAKSKDEVDAFIKLAYFRYLGRSKDYDASLAKFKEKNYPYFDELKEYFSVMEVVGLKGIDRTSEFEKRGDAFLKRYGNKSENYAYMLTYRYGNIFWGRDKGRAGIRWMEDLLKRDRSLQNLKAYGYILVRNCRFDEAKEVYKEMRETYVKNNLSTKEIDKEISKMDEYKLKYHS